MEAEISWQRGILKRAWLRLFFSSFGPVRRTPADGWRDGKSGSGWGIFSVG